MVTGASRCEAGLNTETGQADRRASVHCPGILTRGGPDGHSSYRSAIAKAASTVGIDHAQSRRTEMAAAATTQPTRKPISRRSELFSRSRPTGINGRRGDVSSISDNTALVRLPVITAVETAFGKARRSRAY